MAAIDPHDLARLLSLAQQYAEFEVRAADQHAEFEARVAEQVAEIAGKVQVAGQLGYLQTAELVSRRVDELTQRLHALEAFEAEARARLTALEPPSPDPDDEDNEPPRRRWPWQR